MLVKQFTRAFAFGVMSGVSNATMFTGIAVLIKDGETATAPVEKAELLNKQFSSVFTSEDTDSVPKTTQKKYTNIGRIDVTVDGVMKLLTNLYASKPADCSFY